DRVPPRHPLRRRALLADCAAGATCASDGDAEGGRPAPYGARGGRQARHQPEHRPQGLPGAGAGRARGRPAGPGNVRGRNARGAAAGHLHAAARRARPLASRRAGCRARRREHRRVRRVDAPRFDGGERGVSAILEAAGLGKRYGDQWALRDCSLELPAGRVAALVGPNGAGKTTLLHLAVGLLAPTSGRIELFGAPPRRDRAVLERVGFVAQDTPLYHGFKDEEMLTLGRRLNRRWDAGWADERLHGLGIPLGKQVGALSGGQRAQVALALALAKRPELLLLDEPVASLDPLARREFLQALMDAVAETGVTVVLSSHLIADLERVCDFLVLLRQAEVRLADDIETILARHRLLIGPRRPGTGSGIARIVRESHTDKQS